jgi:hypothetical protein
VDGLALKQNLGCVSVQQRWGGQLGHTILGFKYGGQASESRSVSG